MTDSTVAPWLEWKQRCALGLCSESTRDALRLFAYQRFARYLPPAVRQVTRRLTDAAVPPARDCWHIFETYSLAQSERRNSSYKNWLFARAAQSQNPLKEILEGGASLLMRSAVRHHVAREYSRGESLDGYLELGRSGFSAHGIDELLCHHVSPASEVDAREFREHADPLAAEFFEAATRRERIVILAKTLGISLADRLVEARAGVRRNALSRTYRNFVVSVCARIETRYPDEDRDAIIQLSVMTIELIKNRTFSWGRQEKACADFFKVNRRGGGRNPEPR